LLHAHRPLAEGVGGEPLKAEEFEILADLVEATIKPGRGRTRNEPVREAMLLAQSFMEMFRASFGKKKVPDEIREVAIVRAVEHTNRYYYIDPPVTADQVRDLWDRPKHRR
jgi:hypothetical protein